MGLDFLTDRLQMWSAIKSMSAIGAKVIGGDKKGKANENEEENEREIQRGERDEIQVWWEDIVESL